MRKAIPLTLLMICGCSIPKTGTHTPISGHDFRLAESIASQNPKIIAPAITSKPEIPQYPPLAKAAGIEGLVKLELLVSESGYPVDIQAISGPPALLEPARSIAAKYRFSPATVDGMPVKSIVTLKMFFKIKK